MPIFKYVASIAKISLTGLNRAMDRFEHYAFVEFTIADEASFERLTTLTAELLKQKAGEATRDEGYWLPFFTATDRAEFWWSTEVEMELWNKFWFSTPLPARHSPEMPMPRWDFGSMIDAIMDGEYDLVGVRKLASDRARLEIRPYSYPYGGISAARMLVRAFGHKITGFDDGAGYTDGDQQGLRWSKDMSLPS